jgi:MSHA biogenesis protein MshP
MRLRACVPVRSGGFAIVTAVFIIVALAALAAAIVSLVRTQQTGSSIDTDGARAYQAARAGVEWGAYNSLIIGNCAPATSIDLPGSLSEYVVTVRCSRSQHNEAGTTVNIDTIVANACIQADGGVCPIATPGSRYAERQVTVVLGR